MSNVGSANAVPLLGSRRLAKAVGMSSGAASGGARGGGGGGGSMKMKYDELEEVRGRGKRAQYLSVALGLVSHVLECLHS